MTGHSPELKSEQRKIRYQGREIEINFHFYHDSEQGINYTTTEIDEINLGFLKGAGKQ
jgi:hypothetical protein